VREGTKGCLLCQVFTLAIVAYTTYAATYVATYMYRFDFQVAGRYMPLSSRNDVHACPPNWNSNLCFPHAGCLRPVSVTR